MKKRSKVECKEGRGGGGGLSSRSCESEEEGRAGVLSKSRSCEFEEDSGGGGGVLSKSRSCQSEEEEEEEEGRAGVLSNSCECMSLMSQQLDNQSVWTITNHLLSSGTPSN